MKKKKKAVSRVIALILVLAMAAIGAGGYFVYTYLAPLKTTVYVFNNDYKAGSKVTKDMLTSMQVDAKIVSAAREGNVSMQYVTVSGLDIVLQSNDTLLTDVTKGTALMPWLLSATGGGAIENNLKDNHVAITVPLDPFSGVTNDLRVGSHVNIYSSRVSVDLSTYLLLEDMTVIAVNKNNGAISGATFDCTKEQALTLLHASQYENLYCGLIDEGKYITDEGVGVDEPVTPAANAGETTDDSIGEQLSNILGADHSENSGEPSAESTAPTDDASSATPAEE